MSRYERIIGVDPGLRAMGLAVLGPRARLRHAGVATAPSGLNLSRRLARIADQMDDAIGLFHPQIVVFEETWRSKNPSLALLHRAARACITRARTRGVPVATVPSTTVRRHLLGDGWAKKRETATLLAARYPELRMYLRGDRVFREDPFANLFDAVAVGLWAQQTLRP